MILFPSTQKIHTTLIISRITSGGSQWSGIIKSSLKKDPLKIYLLPWENILNYQPWDKSQIYSNINVFHFQNKFVINRNENESRWRSRLWKEKRTTSSNEYELVKWHLRLWSRISEPFRYNLDSFLSSEIWVADTYYEIWNLDLSKSRLTIIDIVLKISVISISFSIPDIKWFFKWTINLAELNWWSFCLKRLCRWPWEIEYNALFGVNTRLIDWKIPSSSSSSDLTYFSLSLCSRSTRLPPRRTFWRYFKVHFIQYSVLCVDGHRVPGTKTKLYGDLSSRWKTEEKNKRELK